MDEVTRPRREDLGAQPGGLGDIFSAPASTADAVMVASTLHAERLPVANMTVAEIRSRFRDRFDIDPRSMALVDGVEAANHTVVRAGQTLTFVNRVGEKGASSQTFLHLAAEVLDSGAPPETLVIQGHKVCAISPEGMEASIGLDQWMARLAPPRMDTGDLALPDGIKVVKSRGPVCIWVHQTPPRVYSFRWIAPHSRTRYGQGTLYREVRIALPYLIVVAIFEPDSENLLNLSGRNECFFRNGPLESLDDELRFPALLNCSKFPVEEGRPLSWICTQHLDRSRFAGEPDVNRRMRRGFGALMHCLLETGFNYSSETHEGSSWFTESARADTRISSVESWEQATRDNPLFVLDVPWLPTGRKVRDIIERIFHQSQSDGGDIQDASDLARFVFNAEDGD
jgi:hypothetical protein